MCATIPSRRGASDRPTHHSNTPTATIAALTRTRWSDRASMFQSPDGSVVEAPGRAGALDAGAAPRPPPPLRRRRRRLRFGSPLRLLTAGADGAALGGAPSMTAMAAAVSDGESFSVSGAAS